MNDLDGIEANRHSRGIVASEQRGDADYRVSDQQNGHGPVQANGPTEGLFVDHEHQNQREKKPENYDGEICEQAKQNGFSENQLAQWHIRGSELPEQDELTVADY